MNYGVCSIIVTFNRKELLLANIEKLLTQTVQSDIYIIDNKSTDGTYQYLIDNGIISNVNLYYYCTEKNIGGAGGFAYGLRLAFENDYKFAWLMDDDGYPFENVTLNNLLEAYKLLNTEKLILNSLVIEKEQDRLTFGLKGEFNIKKIQDMANKNMIFDEINPFNGTLIPRSVIKKIGYPRADFFINYDEVEYISRAKKEGIRVVTIVNSYYYHPAHEAKLRYIFGKTIGFPQGAIWQIYYRTRNTIYTKCLYESKKDALIYAIKSWITSLFFSDSNNLKRNLYITKGIIAGFKGDFSKNDMHERKL